MSTVIPGIEDRARRGILLMLTAWFVFTLLDSGAKWLAVAGLPAAQIAFFRYAGHFTIATGVLMTRDRVQIPPHFALVSLRGLVLVVGTISNFWALRELPLSIVSAIMFSAPVIVCLLSVTVLGERIGLWRWGAILLGFSGVLLVIRPFGETFHPFMLLCVMNAFLLSVHSLITRALAGKVSTDVMQFWMSFWGTAVTLPLAIWAWQTPQGPSGWAILAALGCFGWAGHQCMTSAHRFARASTLMPFTYSYLLYMTVFGLIIFGDLPSLWTLLGAAVIMASGMIIWKREGL